jgi:hypothetical protein
MKSKDQILLESIYSKKVLKEGYRLVGHYNTRANPRYKNRREHNDIYTTGIGHTKEEALKNWLFQFYGDESMKEIPKDVKFKWEGWDYDDEWNTPPYNVHDAVDINDITPDSTPPGSVARRRTLDANELGKGAKISGIEKTSDEELLNQIKEKEKTVASFMGATLLAGLKAEAQRRGLM